MLGKAPCQRCQMRLELPLNHGNDLCKSGPELPLLQRRPWATRAWNDQEKASAVKKSQVRVTPALDCTCKKKKNARETYIPPNSSGHSWIKVRSGTTHRGLLVVEVGRRRDNTPVWSAEKGACIVRCLPYAVLHRPPPHSLGVKAPHHHATIASTFDRLTIQDVPEAPEKKTSPEPWTG